MTCDAVICFQVTVCHMSHAMACTLCTHVTVTCHCLPACRLHPHPNRHSGGRALWLLPNDCVDCRGGGGGGWLAGLECLNGMLDLNGGAL